MIRFITAVLVALGLSCMAYGGESTVAKEFVVKSKPGFVSQWLKAHPKEVAKSTGCQIISQNGDKIRVRQETSKGLMEFTLQEKYDDETLLYESKLVQVHRGLIEDQKTTVTIEEHEDGALVRIELWASVRDTKGVAIKPTLAKSVKGFQEMVESRF